MSQNEKLFQIRASSLGGRRARSNHSEAPISQVSFSSFIQIPSIQALSPGRGTSKERRNDQLFDLLPRREQRNSRSRSLILGCASNLFRVIFRMQPDNIPQNFRRRDNRETGMVHLEPSFDTGVPSPALGLAGVSAEPSHSAKNFPFIIKHHEESGHQEQVACDHQGKPCRQLGGKVFEPFW